MVFRHDGSGVTGEAREFDERVLLLICPNVTGMGKKVYAILSEHCTRGSRMAKGWNLPQLDIKVQRKITKVVATADRPGDLSV